MADAVHDAARLKELQALPLDRKIQISQARIIEWYQRNHGNVVVSFSGGQWVDNPAYDPTAPEYDGEWKNWNPKQIWVPSKKGLGLKTVFDMVNEIYGKDFYRYE